MSAKDLPYYRAHFREAVQKDGVICLECGAIFKYLPGHLCKHDLSSEEYRAKWGYNRTTPLERLRTRRKKRRNALAMKLASLSPRGSLEKAIKAKQGRAWSYRPEADLSRPRPHGRGLLTGCDGWRNTIPQCGRRHCPFQGRSPSLDAAKQRILAKRDRRKGRDVDSEYSQANQAADEADITIKT